MNPKNSLLKLMYTSIACCLLLAAFLAGCGGGNNPSGPAASTATTAATGALPSLASGTVTLTGSIIDASTGNLVNNSNARIKVTAKLIGTAVAPVVDADNNQAYAFYDLYKGFYLVSAADASGLYEPKAEILDLSSNSVLKISMSPVAGSAVSGKINFFGTIVDAANITPIMAAVVKVVSNSGQVIQASTLDNGQFSLLSLASGSYNITIEKEGYIAATRKLTIEGDKIRLDTKEITSAENFTDGANVVRTGYNLGSIELAQKWSQTGGFQGLLYDPDIAVKTPLTGQNLNLWFDTNPNDEFAPQIIIDWLTTNSIGYFSLKNLPSGFYMITKDTNINPVPIPNLDGTAIIGYTLASPVTKIWLSVVPGFVTIVPIQEQY